MRIRCALVVSGSLLLGLSSAAVAATLSFTGTIGFQVGSLTPVELNGSGVATLNASGGGAHLSSLTIPAAAFVGNPSVVIYNAGPIDGLLFAGGVTTQIVHLPVSASLTVSSPTGSASNAAGAFTGLSNSANNLAGTMPLSGVGLICLFAPCSGAVVANIIVPLSVVGQGGTATAMGTAITVTAIGAPWFKNTATIMGATFTSTVMGFAHGPASATQSTTAQPGGVISLVTPIFVSTSLQTYSEVPLFGRLTLHFAPEPSRMLQLGVAIAVLSVIGRRRRGATTRE